jgi:hypothetical protein
LSNTPISHTVSWEARMPSVSPSCWSRSSDEQLYRVALSLAFVPLAWVHLSAQEIPLPGTADDTLYGEAVNAAFNPDRLPADVDGRDLMERLAWLRASPLDLNKALAEEFRMIPGVTAADAAALVAARKTGRRFSSIIQLRDVGARGPELYALLHPFVTVAATDRPVLWTRSRIGQRLQRRSGIEEPQYLGSPLSSLIQARVVPSRNIALGVQAGKDAGERMVDGFLSGYVEVRSLFSVAHVVAGDFIAEFAEGLVLGTGTRRALTEGSLVPGCTAGNGIVPHRSTGEEEFFRGIAASVSIPLTIGECSAAAFLSSRKKTASMNEDGSITVFHTDGLFTSAPEVDRRGNCTETVMGGRVACAWPGGVDLGFTASVSSLDRAVAVEDPTRFAGTWQQSVGADVVWRTGALIVGAECARARGLAVAVSAGLLFARGWQVGIHLRDYSESFQNRLGRGYGQGEETRNERGIRVAWDFLPDPCIRWSGSIEQYARPWRSSLDRMPAGGSRLRLLWSVRFDRRCDLDVLLNFNRGEHTVSSTDETGRRVSPMGELLQERLRLTGFLKIHRNLLIRSRCEFSRVRNQIAGVNERGILISEEARVLISPALSLAGRIAFFHSDGYDSRLYEYEPDLEGVYSMPPLYGHGRRWMILAKYASARRFRLSAKYSATEMMLGARYAGADLAFALQVDFQIGSE